LLAQPGDRIEMKVVSGADGLDEIRELSVVAAR